MVLNVRPVAPPAEIQIPNGSRAGVFAATPNGKPGAAGTPDIKAEPAHASAAGTNGRAGNSGNGNAAAAPAGISVSGAPMNSHAAAVVAAPTPPKLENVAPARTLCHGDLT